MMIIREKRLPVGVGTLKRGSRALSRGRQECSIILIGVMFTQVGN